MFQALYPIPGKCHITLSLHQSIFPVSKKWGINYLTKFVTLSGAIYFPIWRREWLKWRRKPPAHLFFSPFLVHFWFIPLFCLCRIYLLVLYNCSCEHKYLETGNYFMHWCIYYYWFIFVYTLISFVLFYILLFLLYFYFIYLLVFILDYLSFILSCTIFLFYVFSFRFP